MTLGKTGVGIKVSNITFRLVSMRVSCADSMLFVCPPAGKGSLLA